jgi:hypothetical protein
MDIGFQLVQNCIAVGRKVIKVCKFAMIKRRLKFIIAATAARSKLCWPLWREAKLYAEIDECVTAMVGAANGKPRQSEPG